MKDNKRKLFVVSNIKFRYFQFLMMASLGDNYHDFIDISVIEAKKPLFFRTENPFYGVSEDSMTFYGKRVYSVDEMSAERHSSRIYGRCFLGGNAYMLTRYFTKILSKAALKIAYFGAHLHKDILTSRQFSDKLDFHLYRDMQAKWYPIHVIEEIGNLSFQPSFSAGKRRQHDQS